MLYICSACSFATTRKREWDKHHDRHNHSLKISDEGQLNVLEDSFDENVEMQDVDISVSEVSREVNAEQDFDPNNLTPN